MKQALIDFALPQRMYSGGKEWYGMNGRDSSFTRGTVICPEQFLLALCLDSFLSLSLSSWVTTSWGPSLDSHSKLNPSSIFLILYLLFF